MRELLRARAAACLKPDAMLRVDRKRALFVSDCAGGAGALAQAGFTVEPQGVLIGISPSRALLALLDAATADADDALLRQLDRLKGRSVLDEELLLLTRALKLGPPKPSTGKAEIPQKGVTPSPREAPDGHDHSLPWRGGAECRGGYACGAEPKISVPERPHEQPFEKTLRQVTARCLRLGGGGALYLCRRIQLANHRDADEG